MSFSGYTWYIEPQDSHTNEVMASNLDEENALRDVLCADDRRHNLWQCPSGILFMLVRSRIDMNIKFKIFGRQGNGKIRDKTFLFKHESGIRRKKRK